MRVTTVRDNPKAQNTSTYFIRSIHHSYLTGYLEIYIQNDSLMKRYLFQRIIDHSESFYFHAVDSSPIFTPAVENSTNDCRTVHFYHNFVSA